MEIQIGLQQKLSISSPKSYVGSSWVSIRRQKIEKKNFGKKNLFQVRGCSFGSSRAGNFLIGAQKNERTKENSGAVFWV